MAFTLSAAAQARENYNRKLTDKIPQLYEDAYERYIDGIEKDESTFKLLQALSDGEYKRYLDSIELYNKERELDYKREADAREEEYNQSRDSVDKALAKWKVLGYLDEESARILGLPAGLHTTDYDYKKAQQYKIYSK